MTDILKLRKAWHEIVEEGCVHELVFSHSTDFNQGVMKCTKCDHTEHYCGSEPTYNPPYYEIDPSVFKRCVEEFKISIGWWTEKLCYLSQVETSEGLYVFEEDNAQIAAMKAVLTKIKSGWEADND